MAEFRVWTDKKRNALEAELSGTEGKKIILMQRDGKTISLSPLVLSDEDQKYLKGKISDDLFDPTIDALDLEKPPRLEVDFKKVTNTKNNAGTSSYRNVDMVGSVTIKKLNREPYGGPLKAVMFLIGVFDNEDSNVILDTKSFDFDLTGKNEVSFSGAHFTIREYKYNSKNSTQSDGYLVVVTDADGEVLAMESNSKRWEENYQKLATMKKGVYFDRKFENADDHPGDVTF